MTDPSTRSSGDRQRYDIPVAPGEDELVAARLWAAGALGVWEHPDHLVAWFADRDRPVPAGGRWSVEPDRDWLAEWKATIRPVDAGRITVVPSWLAEEHHPRPDELTLVIDPGRAFGTGHHATTTLCLELLDELTLDGRVVADIGCGTGVLAIAAARRGARSFAVDIDADAVEVARANAVRNRVDVEVAVGSVEALPGPADAVVANLSTEVLMSLADRLAGATRGTLIVSGIGADRRPAVEEALAAASLEVAEVRERDGWVALRYDRAGGWQA